MTGHRLSRQPSLLEESFCCQEKPFSTKLKLASLFLSFKEPQNEYYHFTAMSVLSFLLYGKLGLEDTDQLAPLCNLSI